jgi:putative ABC transport system permease protein
MKQLWTDLRVFASRLGDRLLRRRREQRLADEVQTHLDLLTDEYAAGGLSPADARLAARKAFGGVDQITERYRDARGLPTLDAFVQDIRYAVRLMARDRWTTAAAVTALALGIGLSTFVLSVLYGMNLRALPFEDADAIVIAAGEPNRTQGSGLPLPVFEAWRDGSRSFVAMAGEIDAPAILGDAANPTDQFAGTFISHNVFSILGVRPIVGRDFRPDDDRPGAPLAVVIGHRVWTERYGSATSVIGQSVTVNGQAGVVIGVMPEGFMYPVDTQVWRPLAAAPAPSGRQTVRVLAKLEADVTAEQARDELAAIASTLSTVPEADRKRRTRVMPLNEAYFGPALQPVPVMMLVAVFVVLAIGCSHATNLLLTRSAARAHEISLRTALGAGRGRIIRQLLVESLLMAMLAGIAGFAIAYLGVQWMVAEVQGFGMPYWAHFSFDLELFSIFALVCLGAGIGFGLVPAWHTSRVNLNELLNQTGRSGSGTLGARRLTAVLVIGELALTVMLLSTAILLVRSAAIVYRDDTTMEVASLWQLRVSLPEPQYASVESRRRFYERLDERLRSASGFESAAIGSAPPFARSDGATVVMDGEHDVAQARPSRVVAIGARYFRTLGLQVRRGSSLDDLDPARRASSVLVNERFADTFSKGIEPIGRQVGLVNQREGSAPVEWFTIAGIAPSIRHSPAAGQQPVIYLPHEIRVGSSGTIIVRGHPSAFADVIRQEVRRIDPDLPIYNLLSLARLSEMSRWIPRITSTMMSIVAVIAIVLSALGLYAITAYQASQRTKEVGVRMALGSRPSDVSWLFLEGALIQIGFGLAIGIPGALAAGRLIQGLLIQTSASSPFTLAIVSVLLVAVAVAAAMLPARRASRLDPIDALRHD